MVSMNNQNKSSGVRLSVGFILADCFTLSAFANFVDVIRLSADEGDRSRPIFCRWRVISASMNPVISSSGIPLQPDERLGQPERFDYIVVVGGLINQIPNLAPEYITFLKQASENNIPLVGLCTGGFILHKAGLMQGKKCCVSWFHHEDFLSQFDGIEPISDQIFVDDKDRITCSGGTSSAQLAAYLVERHISINVAHKSLKILMIDNISTGEKSQSGVPLKLNSQDEIVRKALIYIQNRMDNPPTILEISQKLTISRRQLERRFEKALGMTPLKASQFMRLEFAKSLLKSSQNSITTIAYETGFCDASHFIKTFKQEIGITPIQYRTQ